MKSAPLAIIATLAWVGPALAGGPVAAVVEDVTGNSAGVEFMDYVEVGKVIRLNAGDSIVLSYFDSCIRETIEGGTVTIGREQSDVRSPGRVVARVSVPCDPGRMLGTRDTLINIAGAAIRSAVSGVQKVEAALALGPPSSQLTLYGRSPMIKLAGGGGTLEIKRLDRIGEYYTFAIIAPESSRPVFQDLVDAGIVLSPGGVYRATINNQQNYVVKVDPSAELGKSPVIGRLLSFGASEAAGALYPIR